LVEQQMDRELARMAGMLPMLKITADQHTRGLFGSTRSTRFEIGALFDRSHCAAPEAPDATAPALTPPAAAPLRVTLQQTITHGPLPGWGWPAAAAVRYRVLIDGQPADERLGLKLDGALPELTARYGFTGTGHVRIEGGAAQLTVANAPAAPGLTLAWSGVRFKGHTKADLSAMEYEGALPQLVLTFTTAQGEPATLTLKDLALQSRHDYPLPGQFFVYTGKDTLRLGALTLTRGGETQFSAEGIEGQGEGALVEGLLDSSTRLAAQTLVAGGETLGPLHYDFRLNRLDPAAYGQLMDSLFLQDAGACPSPEQTAAMLDRLTAQLPALLKSGPVFRIERISLGYQGQEAVLSGQVSLPATATPEQLAQPMTLLAQADASLTLTLPEVLIQTLAVKGMGQQMAAQMALGEDGETPVPPTPEQKAQAEAMAQAMVAAQVEKALASHWLVRGKEGLSSRLEYRGGTLRLNGKALDLGGLRGMPPPAR
jgi:uncharacterized protein YdgA (DUF945 family)